ATGDDGGNEGSVAPGQVSRRSLRAGLLIELLGQVTARRCESPHGLQERVSPVAPTGAVTKLGGGEGREVVSPTGVIHVALITPQGGAARGGPSVVDRILRVKQGFQLRQGRLHPGIVNRVSRAAPSYPMDGGKNHGDVELLGRARAAL